MSRLRQPNAPSGPAPTNLAAKFRWPGESVAAADEPRIEDGGSAGWRAEACGAAVECSGLRRSASAAWRSVARRRRLQVRAGKVWAPGRELRREPSKPSPPCTLTCAEHWSHLG